MVASNHTDPLADLVTHSYNLPPVTFLPVHAYNDEWRKVYRVEDVNGMSWLMRALRHGGTPAQLQTSATTLFFLEQTGYTAPRVHLTKTGVPIATHAGWSALLLSFVHGVSPDYTPAGLRALGAALAGLHCVDTAGPDAATLPPSRWMLDTLLPQALAQLNAVAHSVPDALASLHRAWDDLYRRMTDWADLPLTLIHGDCWPANAVHTLEGTAILIDWDSAGIGPALLDLGYLIVACHLGKPQLPTIHPDAEAITAVLDGYCRHRKLTATERASIPDAVRFGIAFLGTRHFATALQRGVYEDLFMQKIQARWNAAEGIIAITNDYLVQISS